jgi:hypothetical protein
MNPEQKERRTDREHREMQRRIDFLELQLAIEVERRSQVEALLFDGICKRYFDEHRATPVWLEAVQTLFPKIAGERRDRPG